MNNLNPSGFSMIEVLVTLLLISVGVLGMVALQGRSIQYTQDSVQRNTAISLTNELIEIMRSNPAELFSQAPPAYPMYSRMRTDSVFFKSTGSGFSVAPTACRNPAAAKNAQQQRDCWLAKVKQSLPEGGSAFTRHGYICRSPAPSGAVAPLCQEKGSMIEIQLAWSVKANTCPDARAPNKTTCIYRTRVEL